MPRPNPNPVFIIKPEHIRALDDHTLERLLIWVDKIPLSRPKRNLGRDFSDGVLFAEIIKYFLPKYVELHNYTTACSTRLKESNWLHLNRKVLHFLHLEISHDVIHDIANCKPMVMEYVLSVLRNRIEDELVKLHAEKHQVDEEFKDWLRADQPELDQGMNSRKSDFQSLDDFYMASGLKSIPPDAAPHPTFSGSRHEKVQRRVQEMVPKSELQQRIEACNDKQEMIDTLYRKIKHLEHLVHLKDIRIEEMTARLQSLQDQLSGSGDYMEGYTSPRFSPRQGRPVKTHGSQIAPQKKRTGHSMGAQRRTLLAGGGMNPL